ncbi:MAG: mammalian cell entry protein, partial [Mycobacterium sp.]
GPDIAPPVSGVQTPPGAPNSYDESLGPAPYIGQPGNPMPIGPPPPGPDVIPGPVAPTPAPAGPPPAPAGPPLAAEVSAPAGPGQ